MNYEFPYITNISDVLPAIHGRDEFVVAEKEGYTVINYNVMMADTFPPIEGNIADRVLTMLRRECRGIIFDSKTGDIIRRPFHKFFNVNEREETQDHVIDLSRPHAVLEKLDGSMIAPFIVDGKMIWGTKMGATDVAKPVEDFVKNNPRYENYARALINHGFTPIFEWCSRKQRIVLDYKEDQLILTATRHMHSGKYYTYDALIGQAEIYDIPVVRQWDIGAKVDNGALKSFLEYVRDLEDMEGFVIRFDDGHMLKLKCHWYLQIHKAKEAILQDRNIVELILEEHLDDVKAHLPAEDRDRLTHFESDFNMKIDCKATYLYILIKQFIEGDKMDRKTFAIQESNKLDQFSRAIMFSLWDNYSLVRAKELVRNTIRNNLTKTVKYEAIRDAWFPGVKYNETY